MKSILYLSPLLLIAAPTFAQEQEKAVEVSQGVSLMDITIIVFIVAALTLLLVSVVLLNTFKAISKELLQPKPLQATESEEVLEYEEWKTLEKTKPGIWSKILGLRPISEEKDIKLDHKFDEIEELDNPTPAWFMWLFYATIVFAVGYFANYHVLGYGKLQDEEYAIEMKEAKAAKEAYLAKSGNNLDENSVKESKESAVISAGQAVFNTNCIACHGDKGQGTVGPNLTDEYWLHGGKVNDVFKVIKYGVPEKGMISWEKTLTPKQISEVSNYILSLKGSNPPNPKAPQGEKEG
jgi:cytochrome c oxidase cbb3-type subunit III